jgi:hypothetical protein
MMAMSIVLARLMNQRCVEQTIDQTHIATIFIAEIKAFNHV